MGEGIDKRKVERALDEMAELLALSGANTFRIRAYQTAARRIGELDRDLESLIAEGTLTRIPGIGQSMAEHVEELVRTGRLEPLETLRSRFPPGIVALLDVPDLGPKKLAVLIEALGVEGAEDLERACREHRVRDLPGFGATSEEKLLAGLKTLQQRQGKLRLDVARAVAERCVRHLSAHPAVAQVSEAGSVRRWKDETHDVDVVAGSDDPEAVMDHFLTLAGVETVMARGDTKCSLRLEDGAQVDLRVVPPDAFATALHHFTGSKAHNVRLRGHAQAHDMKVSEWGLYRKGRRLKVRDEAELYRKLGMDYVPPELREDQGEVEAALAHQLPRLLRLEDVRGLTHQHTRHSDGSASVLEMARAAQERGFEWMTITDHSVSSRVASGLDPDRLARLLDEVQEVDAKLKGFRVLTGAEVDILEDGALDYDDAVLARLDVVVASIHSRLGQGRAGITRRLIAAARHPRVHLLGHPSGRLIHAREPSDVDWNALFEACAAAGTALEVNGSPSRLDLHGAHVRQALAAGCRIAVSTDAHSVGELDHVAYAVATARRGWATPDDVINCLGADALLERLATKAPA